MSDNGRLKTAETAGNSSSHFYFIFYQNFGVPKKKLVRFFLLSTRYRVLQLYMYTYPDSTM
eukprot:SAG11_NODE_105_length_16528_cov_4.337635_1_plen_61_part_00